MDAEEKIRLCAVALKAAAPYVKAFAENCPCEDGGAEALADLQLTMAALAVVEQ